MESASDPPADLTGNLKTVLSFPSQVESSVRVADLEIGSSLDVDWNAASGKRYCRFARKGEIQSPIADISWSDLSLVDFYYAKGLRPPERQFIVQFMMNDREIIASVFAPNRSDREWFRDTEKRTMISQRKAFNLLVVDLRSLNSVFYYSRHQGAFYFALQINFYHHVRELCIITPFYILT